MPYIWFERVLAVRAETMKNPEFFECIPDYFNPVIPLFGFFFHTLNFYWFCLIVKKMHRKLTGVEKIDEKNELSETNAKRKSD